MKKLVFILAILASANTLFAQKFGFVDSELILNKMPDYVEAQKEIDQISIEYQQEIEGMYQELDSMFQVYRKEEILLTEEMKIKRQDAIAKKEKEIKDYQRKIFGYEGLIFLKRQELIKPIQEKIQEAIKVVAQQQKLQVVFDKSGELTLLYTTETHDYTDYVLEELGLKEKEGEEPLDK